MVGGHRLAPSDLAGDFRYRPRLPGRAVEQAEGEVGLIALVAEAVEMLEWRIAPAEAAEFAVGDRTDTGALLHRYDLADRVVLDPAQLSELDLAGS
jgi:hypothetical protein